MSCILSWRIFLITIISRSQPDAPLELALTPTEIQLLDHLVGSKIVDAATKKLSDYVVKLAMLGGYARKSDPPPDNLVILRGLNRLADIALGFGPKDKLVDN